MRSLNVFRPGNRVRKGKVAKRRQTTGKDEREANLRRQLPYSYDQLWPKAEDFEARRRIEGGKLSNVSRIARFLSLFCECPEPCETIEVTMIDVNRERSVACARIISKRGSQLEANDGP